jgi:SAM-dependent methyltransferase
MPSNLEKYLKEVNLKQLFHKLGAYNSDVLAKEAEYFTTKEAEKRDKIVLNYFGQGGVRRIVNAITKCLLEPPKLAVNAEVLDLGAGSGFFTIKVAKRICTELLSVCFYAMDMTPAMLLSLEKKNAGITSFVGIAENLKESISQANNYFHVPYKFDAVFSTLMLHHSLNPEKVFQSVQTILKRNGKAIIIDMCEHGFKEFRTEMGDVHLGFKPENIREMAAKYFSDVKVEKMPGICCESSGRSAEIFIALMKKPS